jgi:hypothetical protein
MSAEEVVHRPLPELEVLQRWLARALSSMSGVEVVERRAKQSGTFPKEVVTCRVDGAPPITLFCKYSAPRFEAFGHRRGIPYEAMVYERVLPAIPLSIPTMRGVHEDSASGIVALFLDYLEGGSRASTRWRELDVVSTWLGELHRACEGAETNPLFEFMIRYDRPYYEGWAARTSAYSAQLHAEMPWLPALCDAFTSMIGVMTGTPQTIVHGEFTIHNVMLRDDEVLPTDWESAAVGFGEIDLVCLLDNWTDDIVERCIDAYVSARWPDGAPTDVTTRLLVAELYLHLRWLGEDPEVMTGTTPDRRLHRLRTIAAELGVVS